jgi:hypothetical protein
VIKVFFVITDSEEILGDNGIYFRTSFYGIIKHTNIDCIKISKKYNNFQFASKKEVIREKINLVNERDIKKIFKIMK